jgi:hypothetical protein
MVPGDGHGEPSGRVIPHDPQARTPWAVVGALLVLAALSRVLAMFYGSLSADDATVGLMAKHVLSGENFPVFFYRQTYMGSLNGIHLVPALYVFGPSVLLVRLNAIAWSLLFPLGLYHLGRRILDEPTGRVALALAAVPPFLLTYWSTVAEPHMETNVLGVWLLLLALAALTARSEPARTRALFVFGLLGGLAVWTSIKAVVVLLPAITLVTLGGPRRLLGRGGASVVGGLLLGSMPAWLFYFVRGDRASGTLGSVGHVVGVGVDLSSERVGAFWTEVVLRLLGTYYWDPATPLRGAGLALNCTVYALGVAFGLILLLRCRRGKQPIARAWGLALLLLTLPASLGAVYFSSLADELHHEVSRYALPAYIPLLIFTGAFVARVCQRSRAAGAAHLVFLLLFAAWTNAGFLWPLSPGLRAQASASTRARQDLRSALAARPADALYVDDALAAPLAFLLDRPTVSAMIADAYLPNAVAADAAQRIDILASATAGEVAVNLQVVGATARQTPLVGWQLFEDIQVPARSYRMVPRRAWQVAGDPLAPPSVADGDLETSWPPPRPDGSRTAFVVDLGRPHSIARLVFWPSVATVDLFPLRISASADGLRWDSLGTIPAIARQPMFVASGRLAFRPRNGWLELALTPQPLRYVLVEPAEPVGNARWGVTEIEAYELANAAPPDPVDVDRLVERLLSLGIQRLLADPVASARVHLTTRGAIATLVANGVVDNHGAAPPAWLAQPIRLRLGDALLVPVEDVPELRERLERSGTRYLAEPIGDHALIRILEPLVSTASCVNPTGRSISREPEIGGRVLRTTLEATFPAEQDIAGIRLWHPTSPGPPGVQVAVSRDGQVWQPVQGGRLVPSWGWAGRTLFSTWNPFLEVVLNPTPARRVRVVVTSDDEHLRIICVRELGRNSGG